MEAIQIDKLKENLKSKWTSFRSENPNVRIRDAAAQFKVSEMELLCASEHLVVNQLEERWADLFKDIKNLKRVMALTRNESVVHERKGVYNKVEVDGGHVGLVLDEEIDLRIFFSNWQYAFSVTEALDIGYRHSLQFFERDGSAIHKIYLTPSSDEQAYFDLCNKFKKETKDESFTLKEINLNRFNLKDEEIDADGFHKAWDKMKDTHVFFGLLKKFKVDRMQALRIGGSERAFEISVKEVEALLRHASKEQLEIMVFVANTGMVQIHTGTVTNIKIMNDWVNVLDPEFNLHIKGNDIAHVWVVKKPTDDGQVTAIECYDKDENLILQFFGKRKPGIPECKIWQAYAESLTAI